MRRRSAFRLTGGLSLAAALATNCSPYSSFPPRPVNLPSDAVGVGGSEGYWWIRCLEENAVNRCQVFNAEGAILKDERFQPYDGGPVVHSDELRIDSQRALIWRVNLMNGRILLPSSNFDEYKRSVDEIRASGPR